MSLPMGCMMERARFSGLRYTQKKTKQGTPKAQNGTLMAAVSELMAAKTKDMGTSAD